MGLLFYSLDLVHSNLNLFGLLKKALAGKQFAADARLKPAVTSWLQALDKAHTSLKAECLVSRKNEISE
jgi:hypothetical protein